MNLGLPLPLRANAGQCPQMNLHHGEIKISMECSSMTMCVCEDIMMRIVPPWGFGVTMQLRRCCSGLILLMLTITSLCSSHKTIAAHRTPLTKLDDNSIASKSHLMIFGNNWDNLAMISLRNANRNDIPTPKMVRTTCIILLLVHLFL